MTTINFRIQNKARFIVVALAAVAVLTSCQKKLDYTRPADATNTVKGDIDSAFSNLTQGADIAWAWKFPTTTWGNNFPEFILHFDKDSTADVYSIYTNGIYYDLAALRASGTLTSTQSGQVQSLMNGIGSLKDDDAYLRSLLEDPGNAGFRSSLQVYLPNYVNFNGLIFSTEELNVLFDVNSVVQTSLTFQKSDVFPFLKQQGIVDFDFRLMKFSRDSILLSSYKNDLANVNTTLYPFRQATVNPFVAASMALIAANPLKANVSARLNGAVIPIPTGYNSVLDFFYRSYNQIYSPKYASYGFAYNGLGSAVQPTALKEVAFITANSSYGGVVATAPAGTIVASFSARLNSGASQTFEFVKN